MKQIEYNVKKGSKIYYYNGGSYTYHPSLNYVVILHLATINYIRK